MTDSTPTQTKFKRLVIGTAVGLGVFLFVVRVLILGYGSWRTIDSWGADLNLMLVAAVDDNLFVAALTLVFLALLHVVRSRVWLERMVTGVFQLLAVVTLGLAMVNIQFVHMMRRPFNYQWLYYSDFLRSTDAHLAVRDSLSRQGLILAALALAGMFGLAWLMAWGLGRMRPRRWIVATSGVVYFAYAGWFLQNYPQDRHRLENSVVAFVSSIFAESPPFLFTMKTPVGPEDFQGAPPTERRKPVIRNVLMFVLESVPAEYIEAYGGRHPVTPELNKYRDQWRLFRNVYAHAPATDKSLVSLLCAVYPWISYRSLTHEHPAAALPSLGSELKRHGYRTAFFNCADNRFHNLDGFLAHRGFDKVNDWRDLPTNRPVFVASDKDWPFLDGSDGISSVDALYRWVDEKPEQPFFGVVWTMMTHHPYFVVGAEHDFGVADQALNRYLNALRHTDIALGNLLRQLRERGLAEDTLVIVVGDHGEAFGQHGQQTHASRIYEENLHVPLILINPRLFNGAEDPVIGGLLDIAPTTMDLLGLPVPESWQGRSLFSRERSPRVYFFTPWSDFLFGYREGEWKYIFNATANKYEAYNLKTDPRELRNLADRSAKLQEVPQRLAAWVQYQARLNQPTK